MFTLDKILEDSQHRALSEEALAFLVSQGLDILPDLLEAIRAGTRSQKRNLARAIERLRGHEAVTALLSLLDDPDFRIRSAATTALGFSGDARALMPLMLQLKTGRYSAREDAAAALGNLKLPVAIPALEHTLIEILEAPDQPQAVTRLAAAEKARTPEDWMSQVGFQLRLVVAVVSALAKLGSQRYAPLVVNLMGFHFKEDRSSSYAARVREEAIYASPSLATPGLLAALQAARRREPSGDDVIDYSLLAAFFYLGLRESVDEFIACFAEGYPEGRAAAESLGRIAGLVGETPPDNLSDLKSWWQERRENFAPNVCYRWGQPLNVVVLAEHLPGTLPVQTRMLLDEMTLITGERFDPDFSLPPEAQSEQRVLKAKGWAAQYGDGFVPGSLYKFGHRQDIAALV
jgi:HEAT repeat protein